MFDDLPEYSNAEMFTLFLNKHLLNESSFIEINTPEYSLFQISVKPFLTPYKIKIIPKIKKLLDEYYMEAYTEFSGSSFNVYLHKTY